MAIYVGFAIFFAWLILISWILYKTRRHYLRLVSTTKKEKLDEILEVLMSHDRTFTSEISNINKQLKNVIDHSNIPLQKVGMVRYNPFERSGGEQSFVLSLLNAHNSGIVINFIYTREGLRIYLKKVKNGKGERYQLSDEEEESIKKSSYY